MTSASPLEKLSSNKAFGGSITKYKVKSESLGGLYTQFNVFLPPAADQAPVPVLWFLAGLTCTEDNAPWKGGFLCDAATEGIALIFPDTSPRGAGVPGETDDWALGVGAGYYLNATSEKWAKYYNMADLIVTELPSLISAANLPIDFNKQSISGHSMGGHGAITLYLSNEGKYKSCSAFSPVSNPTKGPWGKKAFEHMLAGGIEEGEKWDSTELIAKTPSDRLLHVLIDYGNADNFLHTQLLPHNFEVAAKAAGFMKDKSDERIKIREQAGYDHSYYFVSTFVADHIRYHAKFLKP
jgi:S-formylglutathione hydrolase